MPPHSQSVALPRRQLPNLYAITFLYFIVFGIYLAAVQRFVIGPLGLDEASVGLAVGSFAISSLVLRPWIGKGIDKYGRRPFLIASVSATMIAALMYLLADRESVVVALRLLQGGAHAALYITLTSIVIDQAPPGRRASSIARFSLFHYAGIGVGPPVAEWLIRRWGFGTTWVFAAAVAGMALLMAFQVCETGRPRSGMTKRRSATLHSASLGPGVAIVCPAFGYSAILGFGSLYGDRMGLPPGILYVVFTATVVLGRLCVGGLGDKIGNRRTAVGGISLACLGLGILGTFASPTGALVGVSTFAIGFAMIFPSLFSLAVGGAREEERASSVGSFTAFVDIGMGGGAYLVGLLAGGFGFGLAFLAISCGCLLTAIAFGSRRPA